MIKLSDRLQIIADRTGNPETMADIGTDHGFLPVYMIMTGRCSCAIMTDISIPSLDKAIENSEKYLGDVGKEDGGKVSFRAGDGLAVLEEGEAGCVVIAGMGGKTIIQMMEADRKHSASFERFVFQPRNGQGLLRKWLADNEYAIIGEDLVEEGLYIPEIVTAVSPKLCRTGAHNDESLADDAELKMLSTYPGDDIRWRIPPWIVKASGPKREFIERNLSKEQQILENVMLSRERNLKTENIICDNISYLKGLLKEVTAYEQD